MPAVFSQLHYRPLAHKDKAFIVIIKEQNFTSEQGHMGQMSTGEPPASAPADELQNAPPIRRGEKLCAESGLTYYSNRPASGAITNMIILVHGKEHFGRLILRKAAADLRALYPQALIIAPNAPLTSQIEAGATGARIQDRSLARPTRSQFREWFRVPPVKDVLKATTNLRSSISPALNQMHRFVSARLDELGMTEENLTLIGFSQGGAIATHVAIERDRACAGVYNLCGIFFDPVETLHRAPPRSAPPIFYGMTQGDEIVPRELFSLSLRALRAHHLPVTVHVTPSYPVLRYERPNPPYIRKNKFTLRWPFIKPVRIKASPSAIIHPQPSAMQFSVERAYTRTEKLITDDYGNQLSIPAIAVHSRVRGSAHIVHPQMMQAAYLHHQGVCDPRFGLLDINNPALRTPTSPTMPLARLAIGRAISLAITYTSPSSVFGLLVRGLYHGYRRVRHLHHHFNALVTRTAMATAHHIFDPLPDAPRLFERLVEPLRIPTFQPAKMTAEITAELQAPPDVPTAQPPAKGRTLQI